MKLSVSKWQRVDVNDNKERQDLEGYEVEGDKYIFLSSFPQKMSNSIPKFGLSNNC